MEDSVSRARIIHKATRLFVDRGYNAVSMREIAAAVGISKAGLYYYFVDKEALFLAILNDNLDHIGGILTRCQAEDSTTRRRISQAMEEIFQTAPEQRAIIRLASQEMMNLSEEARTHFGQVYQEKFIGRLARMLQTGMDLGELRPMDPVLATWVLLGMMYPFFYPSQETTRVKEPIEALLSIYFDGMDLDGEVG
jgi:TetR/AcrR family transcriptional regulator, cholesterol catabolism regulator